MSFMPVEEKEYARQNMVLTDSDKLTFVDIAPELYRTYVFPNGRTVEITDPVAVAVKPPPDNVVGGGSHRVVKANGVVVYIPAGWLYFFWQNADNYPRCRF